MLYEVITDRQEMNWSEEMYPRLGYPRNGTEPSLDLLLAAICVITSYSIHYTKLYELMPA